MPAFAEARPPYITFERRSVEKRKPVEEGGESFYVDVDFALITPLGDKDTRERIVEDWFKQLEVEIENQRIPPEWVSAYKAKYEAFKRGEEAPLNGTSVKNWPAASPAEVKLCIAHNVLTVEDLAQANETLLGRLGMGARSLKARAVAFLEEKSGPAVVAQKMAALEQQNADLKAQNDGLQEALKMLAAKVEGLSGKSGAGSVGRSASLEDRLAEAQGDEDPEDAVLRRI